VMNSTTVTWREPERRVTRTPSKPLLCRLGYHDWSCWRMFRRTWWEPATEMDCAFWAPHALGKAARESGMVCFEAHSERSCFGCGRAKEVDHTEHRVTVAFALTNDLISEADYRRIRKGGSLVCVPEEKTWERSDYLRCRFGLHRIPGLRPRPRIPGLGPAPPGFCPACARIWQQ
jgi:hypothetical protein